MPMSIRKTPSPSPGEIAALRYRHGLNQKEFGTLTHSSLRSVQHWESGEREMHPALWELCLFKLGEKILESA